MRIWRFGCLLLWGMFAAAPCEAAAIQWTTGDGANGHWYWFSFGAQNFDDALVFADNVSLDPDGPGGNPPLTGYDSYLMTLTTGEEQAFVNAHPDNTGFKFWIALSDANVEGTFRWTTGPETGQLLGASNWCPGEPLDIGSDDYVVANFCGAGGWNDFPKTSLNRYGIEWSPIQTSAVPEPGTLVLLATGAALWRRRRQAH